MQCIMAGFENFDSHAYMRIYYENTPVDRKNVFDIFRKTFHEEGGLQGNRLLDFGCGPNLAYVLAAGENFTDIVMADYAESNLEVLQKWKETGEYPFDLSNYYNIVVQSSSKSELQERYHTRMKRLRSNVKEVLLCDANRTDPLTPSYRGTFDAIISIYVLEISSQTRDEYKQRIKNVMTLLKSGGKLIMTVIEGETFWDVGGKKYYHVAVEEELVLEALTEAGMTDVILDVSDAGEVKFSDGKNDIVVTATKL